MAIRNYIGAFQAAMLAKVGKKTPIKVSHFITNRCNLHCSYCCAADLEQERVKELSIDEIKDAMLQFRNAGAQLWDFCGGEPLLRPEIDEAMSYAKELGYIVSIVTNGGFIKQRINALKMADVIMVSLDGPKEVHNKLRGSDYSYDAVIAGIDLLVSNGKTPILNMVITKDNYQYAVYLMEFAQEHKCMNEFSFVVPNREEVKEYVADYEAIVNLAKNILEMKKTNPKIISSSSYLQRVIDFYSGKVDRFQGTCMAGMTFCVLSPEGNVALCLNLFKDGFSGKQIGYKEAFKKLPDHDCDCRFRCYYNTSNLHSLPADLLLRVPLNVARGRWIHS